MENIITCGELFIKNTTDINIFTRTMIEGFDKNPSLLTFENLRKQKLQINYDKVIKTFTIILEEACKRVVCDIKSNHVTSATRILGILCSYILLSAPNLNMPSLERAHYFSNIYIPLELEKTILNEFNMGRLDYSLDNHYILAQKIETGYFYDN